jgi:hypothetical protein
VLALALAACSAKSPQVKVLGISEARQHVVAEPTQRSLRVFLEVVNPTKRDVRLSRIEYHLAAESWFSAKGSVDLARAVSADSVAVVEILIPVEAASELASAASGRVPYRFEGRLFTVEERVERSWPVEVSGTINAAALVGSRMPRSWGHVATAEPGAE